MSKVVDLARLNLQTLSTDTQVQTVPEISVAFSWDSPPKNLLLNSEEVHVWRASLNPTPLQLRDLQESLSADERERASRFYFEKDRQRFIVARGLLRVILARYLRAQPSQLQFCYNPYGKPALAGEYGSQALRFNLSHSEGLVLYAITLRRAIGVDLECIRPDFAEDQIAERFFSPREVKALGALAPSSKALGFFNCWTRKEAYVKARGEGLILPLNQFDVSLVPGEPAALLWVNSNPKEISRWCFQELFPASGYVAALAAEGPHWQLKCWQWPE